MTERKRRPRQLKARSRDSVERKFDNRQNQFARRGVHYLNPALDDAQLVRSAVWEGGHLVLRIWPLLDPERPTEAVMNGRTSPYDTAGLQGMALSELVPTVSYAGITDKIATQLRMRPAKQYDPCSYIIAKSTSESVEGIPYGMLPYPLIQSAFRAASKAADYGNAKDGQFDSRWIGLFPRQHGPREIALPGIKNVSFAVCSVLENGEDFNVQSQKVKVFADGRESTKLIPRDGVPLGELPDDPLIVVELSASAARAIWKICNVPNEDYQGDAEISPAKAFRYGDPTGIFDPRTGSLQGGLFFTIYNPEHGSIAAHTTEVPKDRGSGKGSGGRKSDGFGSYECAVSKTYKFRNYKLSASRAPAQLDHILDRQVFLWPEGHESPGDRSYLLQVPTVEEQTLLLVKALRPFVQVSQFLRYCWSPMPQYLQFDSVRGLLANRTGTMIDGGRDAEAEAGPSARAELSERRQAARDSRERHSNANTGRRESHGSRDDREQRDRRDLVSRSRQQPAAQSWDDEDELFVAEIDEASPQTRDNRSHAESRSTGDEFDDQFDEEESFDSRPATSDRRSKSNVDDDFEDDDSSDDFEDDDSSDDFEDDDSSDDFEDDDSSDDFEAGDKSSADFESPDQDFSADFDEDVTVEATASVAAKSVEDDQQQILSELDVDFDDDVAGDFEPGEEEELEEPPKRTSSESAAIKRSRK